jgi:malate dehydrogenase (oxaloacetate-decarboxylating)(NADP+)
VLKPEMVKTMAPRPIILALANPDPEILPEQAKAVRPDAIIATGRSDYPNQVNNVLCFPYIFRGALDVGATTINEAMKLACVRAIAELARAEQPPTWSRAYGGGPAELRPGIPDPAPFDPRLLVIAGAGGGAGGDGFRRGHASDRRHARVRERSTSSSSAPAC